MCISLKPNELSFSNISNVKVRSCEATELKEMRWKLAAAKWTLPTFARNYLKNEKFMWKKADAAFDNMDRESIIEKLQKLNEYQ